MQMGPAMRSPGPSLFQLRSGGRRNHQIVLYAEDAGDRGGLRVSYLTIGGRLDDTGQLDAAVLDDNAYRCLRIKRIHLQARMAVDGTRQTNTQLIIKRG